VIDGHRKGVIESLEYYTLSQVRSVSAPATWKARIARHVQILELFINE
jgi:hypothetical protein